MKLADVSGVAGLMRKSLDEDPRIRKEVLAAGLYPSQKRMIEELASQYRASQADILRAILDEWSESRLREMAGQ